MTHRPRASSPCITFMHNPMHILLGHGADALKVCTVFERARPQHPSAVFFLPDVSRMLHKVAAACIKAWAACIKSTHSRMHKRYALTPGAAWARRKSA